MMNKDKALAVFENHRIRRVYDEAAEILANRLSNLRSLGQ